MKKRMSWLHIFNLQLFLFVATRPAFAIDFTRFLEEPNITPKKELSALTGAQYVFSAQDAYQNNYRLIYFSQPTQAHSQTAFSILHEALGLPHFPSYPIFALHPRTKLPVPAVLQSIHAPRKVDFSSLTPKQRAEWVKHHLVASFIGAESPQFGLAGDHFVFLSADGFWSDLSPSPQEILGSVEGGKILSGLKTSEDYQIFYKQLHEFLSSLEKMSEDDFRSILAGLPKAGDKIKVLQKRAQALRHKVIAALPDAAHAFNEPSSKKPFVRLPRLWRAKQLPQKAHPMEFLWSYYYRGFGTEKDAYEAYAHSAFGVKDPKQIPQKLAELFDWGQPGVYEVNDDFIPVPKHELELVRDQVTLNPRNQKRLVVVANNDLESITIAKISKSSGANVLVLEGHPQGPLLNAQEIKKISRALMDSPETQELVLVELALEEETILQKLGCKPQCPKIRFIDHHINRGFNHYHPKSSLEQMAQLLGYRLNSGELAIGVRDRSSIAGLKALGYSDSALSQYFKDVRVVDPYKINVLPSREFANPIHIMKDVDGAIGLLIGPIVKSDPYANILIVNTETGFIRFTGESRIAQKILSDFLEYQGEAARFYYGGDGNRAYFGFRAGPKQAKNAFFFQKVIDFLFNPNAPEARAVLEWLKVASPLKPISTAALHPEAKRFAENITREIDSACKKPRK